MSRFYKPWAAVAAFLTLALCVIAQSDGAFAASGTADGKGIVYLVRGGLNVFSTGMDSVAEKLRAKGVDARVLGQAWWREEAQEAIERYEAKPQPVVFVGHSFGANAATLMAAELGKHHIPVALVFLLDPTERLKVPANVRRFVNLLSNDAIGEEYFVFTNAGHQGEVENLVDHDVIHITIDDDPKVQQQVVDETLKALRRGVRVSSR